MEKQKEICTYPPNNQVVLLSQSDRYLIFLAYAFILLSKVSILYNDSILKQYGRVFFELQQLLYHPAWKKQVDSGLDQQIQETFLQTRDDQEKVIIPIRQAINHNGDYLLTVLFHNRTQQAIHLSNIHLSVSSPYFQAVQHQFPTTEWYVEPQTSSPWTFIFREMNYSGELADDVRDLQIEFISTI